MFCFSLTVPVNTNWRAGLNGKIIFSAKKILRSYVRGDFIAALDFLHRQGAFQLKKEARTHLARDQNKVFKSGTLHVVEILFTLAHPVKMIIHLRNLIECIGNYTEMSIV